jgi:signal transduction histidine kinase
MSTASDPTRTSLPSMFDSFAAVTRDRVELVRLSKATLIDLSHVLEDELLESRIPSVVLTGFQVAANWTAELQRYRRLVEPDARTVAVFATGDLGDTGEVIGFDLPSASGLRQEWFIVVQAEPFSCALFGVDRPDPDPDPDLPIDEMERLFDATWTFEPGIIGELSHLVLRVARTSDPASSDRLEAALRRFQPQTASPEFVARFHQRMFAKMERGQQRWREQVAREYLVRQRLEEAATRLRRLERLAALGTTVAMLAHEINNPIGDASARVGRLVHGMLDRARHILTNLVRNGTQADPTGAPVEVEIEVEPPGGRDDQPASHVTLLVRDRGSGISADVVGRSFQPFVTTKLDSGGTGVGLMLAQQFAMDCHGTLTLRSTNAAGTVFALALPIVGGGETQPDATDATDADAAPDPPAQDLGADGPDQGQRVAFVLDDDRQVRAMLGRMLERLGWHVLLAASADEAGFEVLCSRLESVRPGCTGRMAVITGSLASSLPDVITQVVLSKPFGSKQLEDVLAQLVAPASADDHR